MKFWIDKNHYGTMTPLDQPSCSFYQVYQICSIAEITNISMSFGVAEICDVTETTPAGWKKGSPIYHSDRFWGGFYIHFNGCFFDCARDFASYRRLMLIEGLSQLKPIDVRYDLDMMCMEVRYVTNDSLDFENVRWDQEGF